MTLESTRWTSGSRSEKFLPLGRVVDVTTHAAEILAFRNQGTARFGENELASFVASRAGLGAAELVDQLAALTSTLRPRDDVALLALTSR